MFHRDRFRFGASASAKATADKRGSGLGAWGIGRFGMGAIALAMAVALTGCHQSGAPPNQASNLPTPSQTWAPVPQQPRRAAGDHDLSVDEAMGGHTLARHIGKTDAELIGRLRQEPDISSASTYTDRQTAERVIGAALASGGAPFQKWKARQGRRPNFVLRYNAHEMIGRSVQRGHTQSVACERALMVLRWDDRRRQFYVLTSYPEENR